MVSFGVESKFKAYTSCGTSVIGLPSWPIKGLSDLELVFSVNNVIIKSLAVIPPFKSLNSFFISVSVVLNTACLNFKFLVEDLLWSIP